MKNNKILVIVDMQNDFLTGALGNDECRKVIGEVCDVIKKEEYDKVIFTKDTHEQNYLTTQEGKKLPINHCIKDTKGWEICSEITAAVNEKYEKACQVEFCKTTFGSKELGKYLYDIYADGKNLELHFTGVCTGICVINNVSVAKAFCPEAKICVIEKACACVTPDTHKTAIEAMKTFQIDII